MAQRKVEQGGFMILRPDSGDPIQAVVMALEAAEKVFGVDVNSKGYKAPPASSFPFFSSCCSPGLLACTQQQWAWSSRWLGSAERPVRICSTFNHIGGSW